jgi:tripartite ATP-independent transporter DctM subunit
MGALLMLLFGVLMAAGVPIAISMAMGAMGAIAITGKYSLLPVVHKMVAGVDSYVLLAIPFFILAGNLMNSGGVTTRIFNFASVLVGHFTGGLAHANVMSNIIVSGMSGSAVADASGLGQIIIKAMRDRGFDAKFSAAVTCSAATIGPIIPPSIPMVVFGAMAEVSVGSLFMGGVIPGLMLGGATMILVYILSKKRNYPRSPRASAAEIWKAFQEAFLALLTPVFIIGGILTGFCTPTEAAVIASVYALILGVYYRDLTWGGCASVLLETAVMSATIIFIIAAATAFAWVIAMEGITQSVTEYLLSVTTNPYVMVLLLNIVLLIMGMFMEALSILTITVPFLMPLMTALGLDPVHLGVVVVLNLMIGLSTPPVGMSLFVCAKIANISLESLYKEILPFLIPLVAVLFIISFIPDIVLILPRLVFGR